MKKRWTVRRGESIQEKEESFDSAIKLVREAHVNTHENPLNGKHEGKYTPQTRRMHKEISTDGDTRGQYGFELGLSWE